MKDFCSTFQGAQWLEEGGPLATLQHRWAPLLKALASRGAAKSACLRLGLVGPTALGATARWNYRDGRIGPKVCKSPGEMKGFNNPKKSKNLPLISYNI